MARANKIPQKPSYPLGEYLNNPGFPAGMNKAPTIPPLSSAFAPIPAEVTARFEIITPSRPQSTCATSTMISASCARVGW